MRETFEAFSLEISRVGVFFCQFCDVAEVVIIHKMI